MQRHQLEHVIRASAGITGAKEFIIIGSQAILGQFPQAPAELLFSMDADLFSPRSQVDADLIDGSIGEGSPFHHTFGYHAHGVAEETAILPAGWKDRLIRIHNENTGGGTGLCLEVHDLAVSKLVAGREKDVEFITALLHHQLAKPERVRDRLDTTPISPDRKERCLARLQRCLN
jgi:hypothetical protein